MYIYLLCSLLYPLFIYYKYYLKDSTKNKLILSYNLAKCQAILLYRFLCLYLKMLWFQICEWSIWKNIVKVDKNIYELTFTITGKLYKVRFKVKKGPGSVLQCSDNDINDVTTIVEPYLNYKLLTIIDITPKDLNIKDLNIEMNNGVLKKYKNNEKIDL